MASFNKVILLGNLTRDPQVRYIPSGQAVCELGLAVNHTWFDKKTNQRKDETTFVDITLWGRDAEVAGEYLAKGRSVLVEGRLQLDTWDDKATGQKRSKLRVVCERFQMIGGRGEGGDGGGAPRGGGSSARGGGGGYSGGGYSDSGDYGGPQADYDSGPSHSSSPGPDAGGDEVPF